MSQCRSQEAAEGVYQYWLWNPEAGNYGTCLSDSEYGTNGASRYIPPLQGFWIKAAVSGTIGMNNEIRCHSDQNWFNKLSNGNKEITIRVSSQEFGTYDEILFIIDKEKPSLSAQKLNNFGDSSPELYFSTINKKESIIRACNWPNEEIEIGFKAAGDKLHTIDFISNGSVNGVSLFDLETGIETDINTFNSYQFLPSGELGERRFLLKFSNLGITEWRKDEIISDYFVSDNVLNLVAVSEIPLSVQIYDVTGRIHFNETLSGAQQYQIKLPEIKNLWLVKCFNSKGVFLIKALQVNSY